MCTYLTMVVAFFVAILLLVWLLRMRREHLRPVLIQALRTYIDPIDRISEVTLEYALTEGTAVFWLKEIHAYQARIWILPKRAHGRSFWRARLNELEKKCTTLIKT